ncbi:hypothetical protein [Kitasatospora sp. NPDC094015]|uniref:hypothetical protein n=1 Tax=Kitasatospora sp. NPDC094015 TaxID=3155205 RepID=UPI003325822A
MRCPDHRSPAPDAESDTAGADAAATEPLSDGESPAGCPECAAWQRAERRLAELTGRAAEPSERWTQGLLSRLDEELGRD